MSAPVDYVNYWEKLYDPFKRGLVKDQKWYVDNLAEKDVELAGWLVQEIESELFDKVISMNATWPNGMGSNTLESWLHYLVTDHIYE